MEIAKNVKLTVQNVTSRNALNVKSVMYYQMMSVLKSVCINKLRSTDCVCSVRTLGVLSVRNKMSVKSVS